LDAPDGGAPAVASSQAAAPGDRGAVLLIAIIGFIFISTYNDFVCAEPTEAAQRVDAVRNGFLDKLQQADNIAQLIAKMPDLGDAIDARDQGVVAQIVEPFTRFTDLNFLTVYNRDSKWSPAVTRRQSSGQRMSSALGSLPSSDSLLTRSTRRPAL
jgi:Signal transduction histidine kinase regulating citrate/malate metabolism